MAYATEQRMTNAISKHGVPDTDLIAKRIVDEFITDIFEDIKIDEDALQILWDAAAESEKAKVKNTLVAKAKGLVNKYNNTHR